MEQTRGTPPEAGGTGSEPGGRFTRAKDYVGEKYSAASDSVKEQYSAVRDKVGEIDLGGMTEQVRTYVRSNPGKALLISVGVGFLLGLMLRRSDDED